MTDSSMTIGERNNAPLAAHSWRFDIVAIAIPEQRTGGRRFGPGSDRLSAMVDW
jgi:hypothetical protein